MSSVIYSHRFDWMYVQNQNSYGWFHLCRTQSKPIIEHQTHFMKSFSNWVSEETNEMRTSKMFKLVQLTERKRENYVMMLVHKTNKNNWFNHNTSAFFHWRSVQRGWICLATFRPWATQEQENQVNNNYCTRKMYNFMTRKEFYCGNCRPIYSTHKTSNHVHFAELQIKLNPFSVSKQLVQARNNVKGFGFSAHSLSIQLSSF